MSAETLRAHDAPIHVFQRSPRAGGARYRANLVCDLHADQLAVRVDEGFAEGDYQHPCA